MDIAAFVSIFFDHFSQFKGRGFHMAGESYGVSYFKSTYMYISKYDSRDVIYHSLLQQYTTTMHVELKQGYPLSI